MTLELVLLVLAWLVPSALGLLLLMMRAQALVPLAVLAAVPALAAALVVPVGSAVELPWLLLGTRLMFDEAAQAFLLFSSLLWLVAALFAVFYLGDDARRPAFFAYLLLAMSGNFGLIVSSDMASFYVWFAIMSFASYGLIVYTKQPFAYLAGRAYMILVIIGEVLLFAGIVLLGALYFSDLAAQPANPLALLLVFISFGIKAGVVLLHVWLPLAHPAAPVPASAVLSGAMIKAGVIGWMRFMFPADLAVEWGTVIIVLGLATMFYGAVMGVSQVNPKTVLAYSSISQMGFIMVAVGAWMFSGRADQAALIAILLYALHHALAKGALFLGVAFAGANRWVTVVLLLPALALAGLPFTSGAIAKAALKSVTDSLPGGLGSALTLPLALGAIGTTLLMARFLWLIWRTEPNEHPPSRPMWGLWTVLLAAVAGILFVLPDARPALQASLQPDKLWSSTYPVLIGVALSGGAFVLLRRVRTPLVQPGDLLIFYDVISLAAVRALAAAARALDALQRQGLAIAGTLFHYPSAERLARFEAVLRADWLMPGILLLSVTLGAALILYASAA